MAERNRSIDTLKGILIFAVVLGHALTGSLDENPMRYLIYSFHMPAFFFLSGYLIDIDKLRQTSFIATIRKYWKRMLLPWCIAWVLYTLYAIHDEITPLGLLHNIYSPFYHLWFVPSLFLCVIICTITTKSQHNDKLAEIFLLCIGAFLYNLDHSSLGVNGIIPCGNLVYLALGTTSKRPINNHLVFKGGG